MIKTILRRWLDGIMYAYVQIIILVKLNCLVDCWVLLSSWGGYPKLLLLLVACWYAPLRCCVVCWHTPWSHFILICICWGLIALECLSFTVGGLLPWNALSFTCWGLIALGCFNHPNCWGLIALECLAFNARSWYHMHNALDVYGVLH